MNSSSPCGRKVHHLVGTSYPLHHNTNVNRISRGATTLPTPVPAVECVGVGEQYYFPLHSHPLFRAKVKDQVALRVAMRAGVDEIDAEALHIAVDSIVDDIIARNQEGDMVDLSDVNLDALLAAVQREPSAGSTTTTLKTAPMIPTTSQAGSSPGSFPLQQSTTTPGSFGISPSADCPLNAMSDSLFPHLPILTRGEVHVESPNSTHEDEASPFHVVSVQGILRRTTLSPTQQKIKAEVKARKGKKVMYGETEAPRGNITKLDSGVSSSTALSPCSTRGARRPLAYSLLSQPYTEQYLHNAGGGGRGIPLSEMDRRPLKGTGPMAQQSVDAEALQRIPKEVYASMDVLLDGNSSCVSRRRRQPSGPLPSTRNYYSMAGSTPSIPAAAPLPALPRGPPKSSMEAKARRVVARLERDTLRGTVSPSAAEPQGGPSLTSTTTISTRALPTHPWANSLSDGRITHGKTGSWPSVRSREIFGVLDGGRFASEVVQRSIPQTTLREISSSPAFTKAMHSVHYYTH